MLRKRSQAASIERALVFGVRSNCDAPRPAEQDACPRLPRDVLRLQPDKLRAFSLMQSKVLAALKGANRETGGSVLELGEAEYMVRASGYLKTLDDFRQIPPATSDTGIAVRLFVLEEAVIALSNRKVFQVTCHECRLRGLQPRMRRERDGHWRVVRLSDIEMKDLLVDKLIEVRM